MITDSITGEIACNYCRIVITGKSVDMTNESHDHGNNCAFSFGNEQGKVSQLKISKVSGIIAVTIRDRSKEIKRIMVGEING